MPPNSLACFRVGLFHQSRISLLFSREQNYMLRYTVLQTTNSNI